MFKCIIAEKCESCTKDQNGCQDGGLPVCPIPDCPEQCSQEKDAIHKHDIAGQVEIQAHPGEQQEDAGTDHPGLFFAFVEDEDA